MSLAEASDQKVEVNFSISGFSLQDMMVEKEAMQVISMNGLFLPHDAGKPNLPGYSRFIAVPEGATARVRITEARIETYTGVNIAPAPEIPVDTDQTPMKYQKDDDVYSTDSFYPAEPVVISGKKGIRGVDVVLLGIVPFQFNPVTRVLKVYRDMKIEVTFEGGNGIFGEERLRSRWFDPVLTDMIMNRASLPVVDYNARSRNSARDLNECEYLIITPNDAAFIQWADSIKQFRVKQGISTGIVTLNDIGGSSASAIESYIDNIYNTWEIPPVAILILADYGTNTNNSVIAPIWENYCASDNIYADVDHDELPDIVIARITAQDSMQLRVMITKFLNHERTPPTYAEFYDEPITALGWQTERWFQICSETVGGYFKNVHGKNPTRVNEIYDGNPNTDPWSTFSNTPAIMEYFGPEGLGYIPATPNELGGWTGGTANEINNAINEGAFILQHRDHGYEYGWGEPDYSNNSINGLHNADLTFIMSINCLTGKYNISGECFTEKFHRYTYDGYNSGALGLIAASEVSYSFVNDTYVWGFFDNLWPDFLPDYESYPESRNLWPAFGNAAAKYFLEQSSWPAGNSAKDVTYNLFHMHGGAFLTLYSEIPQNLAVAHNPILIGGETSFQVMVNEGAFIALTLNGEILAVAESDGSPVNLEIGPQSPGDTMYVTITKPNFFRSEKKVPVISPQGPYCLYVDDTTSDQNNNGMLEYAEDVFYSLGIKNYGNDFAGNVEVTISSMDNYITIADSTEFYGNIASGETKWVDNGFLIEVGENIPDNHIAIFTVVSTNGEETWTNCFASAFHAPVLEVYSFQIDDSGDEINGRLDAGETASFNIAVLNSGSSQAFNAFGELSCDCEYVTIEESIVEYGTIDSMQTVEQSFTVTASEDTPGGTVATFTFNVLADHNISAADTFYVIIGQYPALIIDMGGDQQSGQALMDAMDNYDLNIVLTNEFPSEDLIFFKSVFLCLGTYYSNYELTNAEGERLVDYLNRGGNLYLEGGTTWASPLEIHEMFNISTVTEGWFMVENIYGAQETFTSGMLFEYDAAIPNNNYYLEPLQDAWVLFNREEGEKACVIANEEDNYSTIGSSVEFGAFTDGSAPSNKAMLIKEYLKFFGILDPYVGIGQPGDFNTRVNAYPNPFNNLITFEVAVEKETAISFEIVDLQGRKIVTLVNEKRLPGMFKIQWDASNADGTPLSPGIYVYRMKTGEVALSGKITLLNN